VRLHVSSAAEEPIYAVLLKELTSSGDGLSQMLRIDPNGIGRLPPGLVGRSFEIQGNGSPPIVIERWNGAPLDLQLRRAAAAR
jgi:hypothetical protein